MSIKIVAFDADDTLWVNENYFREGEKCFCKLLNHLLPENEIMTKLYDAEMQTLEIYGFGIKGFVLSMIDTASQLMGSNLNQSTVDAILTIGKEMLDKPVELLEGVRKTLEALMGKYRLILVTKGDLLDQERKLEKSGLSHFFHHVEVMSNKHKKDYQKLIRHLDIQPEEFLMIGNSLKSDILPVREIGAQAVYVPYEVTWQHETVASCDIDKVEYTTVSKISDVLNIL